MMRQASVAVMEGRAQSQAQVQALALAQVQEDPLSPTKNLLVPRPSPGAPVLMIRSRSGSRVEAEAPLGTVGLRDLLKVHLSGPQIWCPPLIITQLSPGAPDMSDLLPPSPSATVGPQRFFPSPSPLAPPSVPMVSSHSQLSTASAATISPTTNGMTPSGANLGPPIRPLDLSRMESDDVFGALESTIEDMKSWLECVENGLDELLKFPLENGMTPEDGVAA